jgi:putative NIF3 family GTP cyclohydrolase 1 type 2
MTNIFCFVAVILALFATPTVFANGDEPAKQSATVTAAQVIDRIKANVGVPWMAQTVDTFKAGDPSTPITGVATTMMATFDVLQRAAAANRNLIITHEPTFYGHQDQTTDLENEKDPTYTAKQDFIAKHHLVVWRFHDHWHQRRPDGILTGMVKALGWESSQRSDDPSVFTMKVETTLQSLAADIRTKLDAKTLRVVGDPQLKVTAVALSPGFACYPNNRRLLQMPDVQVVIIGEAHEWEAIEHAADASAAGLQKGLIAIGHIPSEQAGMDECARWLRTFVTEVPVDFIPTKDPFWRPQ